MILEHLCDWLLALGQNPPKNLSPSRTTSVPNCITISGVVWISIENIHTHIALYFIEYLLLILYFIISITQSIYLSVYLLIYLQIYLSISPSVNLSIYNLLPQTRSAFGLFLFNTIE